MENSTTVGLVHPGAMGVTIGAAMTPGSNVMWASADRSQATLDRAAIAALIDVGTLSELVNVSSVIVSVCPPAAALDTARAVAELGFGGTYVDANAVSPATSRAIAGLFGDVVDGGIVGPPVRRPGTTRLYLSGPSAGRVETLFLSSPLEVRVIDGGVGAASAVKMAFAAWTKGTSALLLAINALAEREGVLDDLRAEWETSMPELVDRSEAIPATIGPKAWRFEGEMHEIADSFSDAGLPDGFHLGAADIYRRLSAVTDVDHTTLDDVLRHLGDS